MKIFKKKSIMLEIWLAFTFMIVIIILCISLLYLFRFREFDENAHIKDMKTYHEIMAKTGDFNCNVDFNKLRNLANIEDFIVNFTGDETKIQYVGNSVNQVLPPKGTPGYNKLNWVSNFAKNVESEKQFKAYYNNGEFLIIITPIKGKDLGKSYLVTYMPYYSDNRILYEVIIIGIIFIIIAFFTSKVVAIYISKPIRNLQNYTQKIAEKNWSEPIKINSDDEIGDLARSMNIMQRKLKYADENEKLFLQSISHDLKTSVMIIMSHAASIVDGLYIDSVEKTAEIVRDEAMNLQKKIKQILYLNTLEYALENNIENVNNEYIDLQDMLNGIVNKFKAINSNIKWNIKTSSNIIFADKEKVEVCIGNILDNALRYAREVIRIKLERENNFAVIEIYNDGSKIQDEKIKLIFNNMYKDKDGNFGLGLAISKKIADSYNGDIKAINRKDGVSFILKYPIIIK